MHRRWGVQPDAGVAVDVVVVIEERGAEGAGVFDRAEAAGEHRGVLESFLKLASEYGLSLDTHGIGRDQLTLHADRGTSMTSKLVAQLLIDLGVARSHSRPHVARVSAMTASASSPVSAGDTIHPTT